MTNIISIKDAFKNGKAVMPYVMSGEDSVEKTIKDIKFLAKVGADIIEVGVPYSDPIADGDVIYAAATKAIRNGITIKDVFHIIEEVRKEVNIPLVVMTYINPVVCYGLEEFFKKCNELKVGGIIVPDLPLEEIDLIKPYLEKFSVEFIPLVSINSSEERVKKLCESSNGFLYAVSVLGITGERGKYPKSTIDYIRKIKDISALPVALGFGVTSREQVDEIYNDVDGFIIGTKIVRLLEEENYEELEKLVKSLKD